MTAIAFGVMLALGVLADGLMEALGPVGFAATAAPLLIVAWVAVEMDAPERKLKGEWDMKVLSFQGGRPGVITKLPGEEPLAELGELLGGEVEEPLTALTDKLALCVLADGIERREPIRYSWRKLGRVPQPVAGDCAVVHMGPTGLLGDMTATDMDTAEDLVRPIYDRRRE